ncbi:MAG: ribulose-phosphate 3-epimerase [Thaumarchaeota archaeon]|nr:ribulose-phosphate 3-epimerase [Nitrososphaerota archaeon]
MREVKIAPSVLAYDLTNLRGAVDIAAKGGADLLHLDVIDGHFAPNITFGSGTIDALRHTTRMKFDVHLMINQPRRHVHDFLDAGADIVIFQVETVDMAVFDALFAIARSYKKEVGLALKPETDLPKWVESRLDRLRTILVLTVQPGFSGQRMDVSQFPKIERINKLVTERGLDIDIEIDGGIGLPNIGEVARRGGNSFVAGAGVYATPNPVEAISKLREAAIAARSGI